MSKNTNNHVLIIKNISNLIKQARIANLKLKIYHGSSNSTRQQNFRKNQTIDTSKLNNILEIDTNRKLVTVEPNVSMAKLFDFTYKHGFIPQVVMEFSEITVGGGIAGISAESSSFKYGGFHETATEYEIVLGNGEVITANKSKNSDIFHALPGSYGTLGVITKIKLKLIPAKPYVRLTYLNVNSLHKAKEVLIKNNEPSMDFTDGILFSKQQGVIMIGKLTDRINLPIYRLGNWWNEWFYIHAQNVSKHGTEHQELIPIKDYLFRYDRNAFWVGKHVFERLGIPLTRFTRLVLNPFMNTKSLFRGLQLANISQDYLIQDYCLPSKSYEKMYTAIEKELGTYPLWLLAVKPGDRSKLSPGYIKTDTILNIGTYGRINNSVNDYKKVNRKLEKKLHELGGKKVFYAHSYYTKGEFWNIYDKKWYDELRLKYSADTVFTDIYNKINVKENYKSSVIMGVFKFFLPPYKLSIRK